MMTARSVRARRSRSSAASTSAAVAVAAGLAAAAGGRGLPTRDFSAGRALLPERTLSGRRGAVELAPRLSCIVVHK